ncbi:hypothetical protein DFH09DRAFT_1311745 [Mycena vulgaris]|nr:hypothetical protein DFH09DRAFT_1311745 [Mycena vulgaris]
MISPCDLWGYPSWQPRAEDAHRINPGKQPPYYRSRVLAVVFAAHHPLTMFILPTHAQVLPAAPARLRLFPAVTLALTLLRLFVAPAAPLVGDLPPAAGLLRVLARPPRRPRPRRARFFQLLTEPDF